MPIPKTGSVNNGDHVLDQKHTVEYLPQKDEMRLSLECVSENANVMKRHFIKCSSQVTILHLKKFVAGNILKTIERFNEVEYCKIT